MFCEKNRVKSLCKKDQDLEKCYRLGMKRAQVALETKNKLCQSRIKSVVAGKNETAAVKSCLHRGFVDVFFLSTAD